MIGRTLSHYHILGKIGEGGMGVVYEAEDILLGRRVAVKALNIEAGKQHYRQRFLREARAVSILKHPNIAIVHDYGETPEGKPFIVMELVQGETLEDFLRKNDVPLQRSLEIIKAVAKALREAHRHGIIHRDIKPSNIAVTDQGEVKVLDFGLAKNLKTDSLGVVGEGEAPALLSTQTREGVIIGTPLYLSPEQALGMPVDERSDLFSLGSLLYECVTGQPAFACESPIAICAKVIRDDPQPPSQLVNDLPRGIDQVTLKLLSKRPEDRYQSVDELLIDLDVLISTLRSGDRVTVRRARRQQHKVRTSLLMPVSEKLRRPHILFSIFLATFVIALLAVWGMSYRSRHASRTPAPEALRWYEKGMEALRNGRYFAASKLLQEAVKADDGFVLAHLHLAEALSELDYTDKAKNEIIRVGQLVPDRTTLQPLEQIYLEAITNNVTRDFAKAVDGYQKIEEQVDDQQKAAALLDLGNAYEKNEDLKRALQSYQEAIKRDPQYAAAYLHLGIVYGRQQDISNADTIFNEAQRLYEISGDIDGGTEVLYQRGFMLNKLRKIYEARDVLRQALAKAQATGSRPQQILILLQLSSVSVGANDLALAREQANEAVDMAQANDMENLSTRGLIDLGNTFFVKGNYSEAENYFKQALDIAQRNKGRRNEARALLSIGSLYTNAGKPSEAKRYAEQALEFYKQGGYRKETSQAFAILGHASDQLGEYEEASNAFKLQLDLATQLNDQSQAALAHEGLGLVLVHQERYPEALGHFIEKYRAYEPLGTTFNLARTRMQQARVLWPIGRYEDASNSINQAIEIAKQSNSDNSELMANIHLVNAHIALSSHIFQQAEKESQQALDLADKNDRETVVEAEYLLGLAQALSGKPDAGRKMCEKAVTLAGEMADPYYLSGALLALAEAMLKSGDAKSALATALRAESNCARFGQQESEWRAWLFAALASKELGESDAHDYATRAYGLLISLKRRWGADAYNSYLSRRDAESYSRSLQKILD